MRYQINTEIWHLSRRFFGLDGPVSSAGDAALDTTWKSTPRFLQRLYGWPVPRCRICFNTIDSRQTGRFRDHQDSAWLSHHHGGRKEMMDPCSFRLTPVMIQH